MRLIDADAMFDENHCYTTFNKNLDYCDDNDLGEWIDEQPTVNAEPVRRGRWIKKRTTLKYIEHYECSACGSWQGMYWMNYCPNCGAKMDGGKQDANV